MSVPSPPLVLTALQTELDYLRPRRPLLMLTEIRPVCRAARARAHPYHPIPLRGNTPPSDCLDSRTARAVATEDQSPTPASTAFATPSAPMSSDPTTDSDEESQTAAELTVKVAEPDADGLISKPEGEVGRQKRGYPLMPVLGWDSKRYKKIKNQVNAYVADYLNHASSSSNQPAGKVEDLTKLVSHRSNDFFLPADIIQLLAQHPKLAAKYRNGWPISDLIHLRLKYTSGRIANGHRVPQSTEYPKNVKKALVRSTPWICLSEDSRNSG